MKHKLQTLLKHKLQWLLLLAALLGVNQGVWGDYYYRGGKNSWGATKMTQSSDGTYWYYTATSGNHEFKITTGNNWDTQYTTIDNSLGSITLSGGNGNNIVCNYSSGQHYVIIYSNNQRICASSSLPTTVTIKVKKEGDYASSTPYLYAWAGTSEVKLAGAWPGSAMTYESSTNTYKFSISKPNANYSIIISQNGSNQTSDITGLSGDKCYSVSSKKATAATASKPTVSSTDAASITSNSATLGGNVTDAGQTASCGVQTVTARGIEWVSGTGKTAGAKEAAAAGGTGSYTVAVTGLSAGTTYTYKAYATNATGTSYGSNQSFTTTSSCTTVTSTSVGGATTMSLTNGASEAITSSTTYVGTITPTGAGDTYSWSVSPEPFSGSTTIGTSTATSTTIRFRREGQYAVKFAAGCGSASVESSAYTVNVYPGNLYVAGPLVNNSWTVTPASQTMTKTGSGTSSVYTYEWTAPSDFVAGSSSVEGGEFTVQSVTNMSLPNYILPAYCPADPSTYTNIYRVTNTTNHNLRCTFAVSSGDKLKLRVAYNGTTGSPKAPYYTFTLNKVPVPTTGDVTNITWTQAKLWGTYPKTSEYEEVTSRGFYYGTTSSPGTKVLNGAQSAGSIAKTITGLTPGTTYYYKAFVVSGGVEYYGSVESFTTTACSNPTVSTQPSTTAREYCKDEASPASLTVVATGGVGEYTYQWKQCATSGGTYTNVSAGSGGTTATYTPSTATAGGLYYKCVVTNSGICTSNSVTSNASGKYTIDAASVGGSISGGSTSVCPGTTKNLTLGSYTGSIQWHSSSTSGFTPSSTTAISGATSATYAAPISTAGTKYYKAVVTNGVCASATSSQSYLTVKRSAIASDYTLTNNAQTYNGSARAVTVTPASGAGAATVYYTGTGSTTYAKSTTAPTNAGSYSITIDAAAGDDYCAATNLSLGTDSIKKATQSTLTISNSVTSLVYCDDASVTLTTTGGSGSGAVTYAVTSGSGSVEGDVLSPSARGSVTVVADKAASANYKGIKSAAKTFNFNVDAPTVYTLSNVGGATTICGDPSTGAGSGTLRLANSQTGYNYQLYSNGSPVEGYAAKAGTDGSSIDFPVTSSGTYTVYAYYGTNSSNCATQMDGEITLTISTQPKLVRSAASVTEYMPVTITSVSTDIAEWKIVDGSGNDVSSSTAYLFDQTYDAITFKGASTDASTPKTYTIKATTAGGCSETTTVTVNPDTESCGS